MVFPASFEGDPRPGSPNAGAVSVDAPESPVPSDWERVRPSWRRALEFSTVILRTTVEGKVSETVYWERMQSCSGINDRNQIVGPVCPLRREYRGVGYCGACGCGATPLSRLDSKLWYSGLKCPLSRKGFQHDHHTPPQPSQGTNPDH